MINTVSLIYSNPGETEVVVLDDRAIVTTGGGDVWCVYYHTITKCTSKNVHTKGDTPGFYHSETSTMHDTLAAQEIRAAWYTWLIREGGAPCL